MSDPQQILPGKTWMITRRTTGRFFLFRPDRNRAMQGIFLYCLAYAAGLFEIQVHAAVLMSTHYHVVLTDVRGVLPDFLERFNRLVAVVTQCHRGWSEAVFNRSQSSRVELVGADVMLDKIAYVLCNPVAAMAVRYASDWPGLCAAMGSGRESHFVSSRSKHFFRARTWKPEETLDLVWPSEVLARYAEEEATSKLDELLQEKEREARAKVKAKGLTFLGAERCLKVSITRRAIAYEVWGKRNPTFATGTSREQFLRLAAERRAFRAAYREARVRWLAGERDVEFPPGTWQLARLHGARVQNVAPT